MGEWKNMKNKYIFYDSDVSGNDAYDIQDSAYKELLNTCLKYCTSVSFCFRKAGFPLYWNNQMENYRIPVTQNVRLAYKHYGFSVWDTGFVDKYYEIHHYRLCEEVLQLIIQMSNSVFSWVSNNEHRKPDDPIFYRSDGSIFFSSTIHEGYCCLTPKNGEDISNVLATGNWVKQE